MLSAPDAAHDSLFDEDQQGDTKLQQYLVDRYFQKKGGRIKLGA